MVTEFQTELHWKFSSEFQSEKQLAMSINTIYLKYLTYASIWYKGLLGFFVSWQFGACYSWIAQKGDITGRLAPLFLVSFYNCVLSLGGVN